MKLVLCGFGNCGADVLRQAVEHPEVDELFLLTHEPVSWMVDVREVADDIGVPWTSESINTAALPFDPDVISSVWYREIIGQHIIDRVDGRIFNLHPSLLPRHRGSSSVPWAIIDGDSDTGITAHYIDAGVDTGPILLQTRIPIEPDETQASLYAKCLRTAASIWPAALAGVLAGDPGVEQGEAGASYHPRGAPFDGVIDDSWPDAQIERFIRAMTLPPLPYATYRGREVKTFDDYLRLRPREGAVD